MPPAAFALVGLFSLISITLGVVAWWVVQRPPVRGPLGRRWAAIPIGAAFGAFYLIGHRLGIAVGPSVRLFGFDVTLLGDTLIGGIAAGIAALLQAVSTRAAVSRRARGGG